MEIIDKDVIQNTLAEIDSGVSKELNKNETSNMEQNVESSDLKLTNKSKTIESEQEPRRSKRIKNMPNFSYKEMVNGQNCYLTFEDPVHYTIEGQCYYTFAQSLENDIPESYNDIKGRSDRMQWEKAIDNELKSLNDN